MFVAAHSRLIAQNTKLEEKKVTHTQLSSASEDKAALLAVERPLVFQPLPVSLHTANLLPVVVRHGVRNRVGRRVHAESTNAVEEFFLLL